jgi:hypothetical protein
LKTLLVACETISDEVVQALDRLGLGYPVRFLEGGLHRNPERLGECLRGVLGEAEGLCERLILALGWCGGGMDSLSTGSYETVLPLADDCLTLLFGSTGARRSASAPPTYFLTGGWLRDESSVVKDYDRTARRFGAETAARLNRTVWEGYARLGLLDTGAYDLGEARREVTPMAAELGLEVATVPADLSWLDELLLGPHDDPGRFLRLPPGARLSFSSWKPLFSG